MYGVRYAKCIGDGDSNVYIKLLEQRPYKNLTVQKVECKNHLYRNCCNKLRDITKNRRYFGEHRKYLSGNIFRIRNAIAKAVKFRKISNDIAGLRIDIEMLLITFLEVMVIAIHIIVKDQKIMKRTRFQE